MHTPVLKLDAKDNVVIALRDLRKGDRVRLDSREYTLATDVRAKHKFASEPVPVGGPVIMYGVVVGRATSPIELGEVLTTRNMRHDAAGYHEKSGAYRWTVPDVSKWQQRTFQGYARADGQVGTRNHWLVVPLVFCENRNIAVLEDSNV